jgi:hypothetical protein
MKKTIISITLIFLSLISFSQTEYFAPNLYTTKVLDSLDVPYLPINLRVKGEGFSKNFKSRHLEYFSKDLRYTPYTLDTDITFKDFITGKEMVDEKDFMYVSILSGLNITVIGSSVVPLFDDENSSIMILELHCNSSSGFNCYTAIAFYETKDGKLNYINENLEPIVSSNWEMSYK